MQVANQKDMRAAGSVKAGGIPPRLVAVIASPADLARALRLRRAPDLFELRLDALLPSLGELAEQLGALPARLLITARHGREGGHHDLSAARRRRLLLRFLPRAAWVDLELRSVTALRPVLQQAAQRGVRRIISVHEFTRTPEVARLREMAQAARAAGGDVFKLVTRTDTPAALQRLLEFAAFAQQQRLPFSAMGVGALGRTSRILLAQHGSVLHYAHLGTAMLPGQLSLPELRRTLAR